MKDKPVLKYYIVASNGGWVLKAKQKGEPDSVIAFFFEEYQALAHLVEDHLNGLLNETSL